MRTPGPRRGGRPGSAAQPRALSSDAWYTLIYLAPAPRRELHRIRQRTWLDPLLRAGLGRPEARALLDRLAVWKRVAEGRGRTPPLAEQIDWLADRVGRPLDVQGISDRLDRQLLAAAVRPAPGAAQVLRQLSDRGIRLAVVSNVLNETATAARTVLDRAGLLPLFRVVYLSSEHPWSKPRPEPFRVAAKFLGVPAQALVHIGDLTYDLDGARSAGASPVLFTGYAHWNRYLPGHPDGAARQGVHAVRTWSDLLEHWPGLVGR